MKCNKCSNEMELGRTGEWRSHRGVGVLFKDVPCLFCPECGEVYVHDKELDIIETKMLIVAVAIDNNPDAFMALRFKFDEVAKDYDPTYGTTT